MDGLIQLFNSTYPISNEEKALIRENLQKETIAKNQIHCHQGKICKKLSFVLSGIFKCVRTDPEGNEYIPYFIGEGHFAVALDSFTNQTISQEYIQALTECVVLSISRNTFDLFEQKIPNFPKIIGALKEKALVEKDRLKSEMLISDAETRYQKLVKEYPLIIKHVSQKNIAQFLGVTQYTLSRIRSKK